MYYRPLFPILFHSLKVPKLPLHAHGFDMKKYIYVQRDWSIHVLYGAGTSINQRKNYLSKPVLYNYFSFI